jgi:integrase
MPSGAAVIRREGKRATTFAIKWRDHEGRQCWERLGKAPQWNETRAQRELGKRLDQVEREQWRKPGGVTFGDFADRFRADYLPGRNLKPSTVADYGSIVDGRLVPFFGDVDIARIDAVKVDGYISHATAAGMSPKTVKNHLGLLRVMFKVARRWRLVHSNPVDDAEMPRVDIPEMSILTESEITTLIATYRKLEQDADTDDVAWWRLARHIVEFALGTAMRRGEIIGIRWKDVEMLDRRVHVRETIVRGQVVTPKSRTSRRTMEIGPAPRGCSTRCGRTADTAATTASSSAIPPLERPSTRRSCPVTTCGRRSRPRASSNRSDLGMTYGTPHSRTRQQLETRTRTCRRRRGTVRARSPTATSTPHR